MPRWPTIAIIAATVPLLTALGVVEHRRLDLRFQELSAETQQRRAENRAALERAQREQSERTLALEAELDLERTLKRTSELAAELAAARARLAALDAELERKGLLLEALDTTVGQSRSEALAQSQRLVQLEVLINTRLDGTARAIESAERRLAHNDGSLAELSTALHSRPDSAALWRLLMAPVVQIAGRYTVGSGVLLESQPHPDGEGWRTFVLTAWHVVRDVQSDPDDPRDPVPIAIYLEGGGKRHESARLLAHNRRLDVALLELDSRTAVPYGTRLASPERLASLRPFDPVTAVGCPLGNDPLPSTGQVSSSDHRVDGTRYLMVNAPTYIGNSGGAIYDGITHELIGVFAKIYNHGSARPMIVPHMGLVVPLDGVYTWLADEGYTFDGAIASLTHAPRPAIGKQTHDAAPDEPAFLPRPR